jgi:serine/threonine protein kinase
VIGVDSPAVGDDLVIGGQLGNYLIESVIGRGGMSVVYRAKHARLGTSVALKVLAPELSSDDSFRERFLREAQMAAAIDHAHVVPIHDTGLHDGSLYIVMRYVSGSDLKTLLATSGPLDAEQALSLLTPVAQALDVAHAHGLVHRDVKPANILLQRSAQTGAIDHVYLTDFGIAKSASISGLTRAGGLIGTVEYMPPEQVEGGHVSAQTDVYSLAGVFYECITGKIPFERELAQGALPPVGALEPVSSMRPELPRALDGVIAKGLSRDPADRYATCEQFIHACSYVLEARTADAGAAAGETVVEPASPARDTAADEPVRWPEMAAAEPAAPVARGGGSRPPADQPPPSDSRTSGGGGRSRTSRRPLYAGLAVAAVAAIVAVVLLSSSSSKKSGGKPASAALAQVPTNHVTGAGNATVALTGNVAKVTVTTNGLDNNESLGHALHIHGNGKGQCPPASAARDHNGHRTISTTDGINYYGAPVQALTTRGDTSTSSILTFARYPTGGKIRYTRTITLPPPVAAYIRQNNAVIVVHGVDYDHSGIYSGVLDRSELNKSVPGTATAPALCGVLSGATKTAAVSPRSRAHTLVFTAALVQTRAQAVPASALFECSAAEAAEALGERRRQATAHVAPERAARALG